MKKRFFCGLVLALLLCLPQVAHANMAAPQKEDVGSAITFAPNDAIAVEEEILDIAVTGAQANIVATYKMKNTTGEPVATPAMFLSPNIVQGGVEVVVNGQRTPFAAESYALHYDTEIDTEGWRYAVLSDKEEGDGTARTVDTVVFEMSFAPYETYDVVVSYTYCLGGYPTHNFNVKMGCITYYLAPASMWQGFGGITIHLTLDEDMPVVSSSNLPFEKTGRRTYQYVSDTLPEGNLEIVIDENWWQNIFSTLRSPYLPMTLVLFLPYILLLVAAVVVALYIYRRKKQRDRR